MILILTSLRDRTSEMKQPIVYEMYEINNYIYYTSLADLRWLELVVRYTFQI